MRYIIRHIAALIDFSYILLFTLCRFDPDRFAPENVKDRPSLAYQPFGFAGKRKCPGWRFSISEGVVFMSVFFRRFKVDLVKGQKVEPVYRLVTSPKEEFWITISQR